MSTPIESLAVDETIIEKIRRLSIKTLDELLALYTSQKDDPEPLAGALDMSNDQLEEMIEKVKKSLPAAVVEALTEEVPTDKLPLGAFLPEEFDGHPAKTSDDDQKQNQDE
jgi:hypothetical protein